MHRTTEGSTLIVVLLLASLLTIAGLALAIVARQERGLSTLHARELRLQRAAIDAVRASIVWFEEPSRGPSEAQIQRHRLPLNPLDPQGPPLAPVGEYKAGVDLDQDGSDDLFHPPYRDSDPHRFIGHRLHPDLSTVDASFLDGLSRELFGAGEAVGIERRRVVRVELYAPPTRLIGGAWRRYGIATVSATVVLERRRSPGQYVMLGRRQARGVLQELPYRALGGPMVESCGSLTVQGGWSPRWGEVHAAGDLVLADPDATLPASLPRGALGELWSDDAEWVTAYSDALDPADFIPDPWLRVAVGGSVTGAPSAEAQPWPHTPPAIGTPAPWECCGHSHIRQSVGSTTCSEIDYAGWKALSQSGLRHTAYYEWVSADRFRGADGLVSSAQEIVNRSAGEATLRFFDTRDGLPPRDEDADGIVDNLTPPVSLSGRVELRGLTIAHSERWTLQDLEDSLAVDLRLPGEPLTADGTAWVDLERRLDQEIYPGGPPEHAPQGPVVPGWAAIEGTLIQVGDLSIAGTGSWVGRIRARSISLEVEPGRSSIFPNPELRDTGVLSQWRLPRFVIGEIAID